MSVRNMFKRIIRFFLIKIYGSENSIAYLFDSTENDNLFFNKNVFRDSNKGDNVNLGVVYKIINSSIDDYTYLSQNTTLNNTHIGKFCSIGPNLLSGWGIHPTNGISTAPMFYSTSKQNGITLSDTDKIEETKPIHIGNDVFIGMNVTILDGVNIGDGAIIGAGSVVSKDIPPYAIAFGNPIKIVKYRFAETIIQQLLEIKWWNWDKEELKDIECMFFNIDSFVEKYKKK